VPDTAFAPINTPTEDGMAELARALQYGLTQFLNHCGLERVVVGASGGIDSAVVATLLRQVLPAENLLLVNMPGQYNSQTTRGLAADLARNLELPYASVAIEDSVALTIAQLDGLEVSIQGEHPIGHLKLSDFVLENVQARDRSSRILAGIAAAFGGAFSCNANKSEMTVGYSTLYGDLGGFMAPIADLWKGEVYALARHLNQSVYGREVIPEGTLSIVPSAELSSTQNVDQGMGDPLIYHYHDRLFASWVE
jgi:NAD+ synthase (glutamine-hydrolysing)